MFRFKKYTKLKGSVYIYILFWGMLCLCMAVFAFSLEVGRKYNIDYIQENIVVFEESQKAREELFSKFYSELKDKNILISQEEVDKFIADFYQQIVIYSGECKLYFKEDGMLIFKYKDEDLNNVFECYKVKCYEGRLKFIKLQKVYIDGEIDL